MIGSASAAAVAGATVAGAAAAVAPAGGGTRKRAVPEPGPDSSSDEDTSDEAFAARHAPWEVEEHTRFLSHTAGAPLPLNPSSPGFSVTESFI